MEEIVRAGVSLFVEVVEASDTVLVTELEDFITNPDKVVKCVIVILGPNVRVGVLFVVKNRVVGSASILLVAVGVAVDEISDIFDIDCGHNACTIPPLNTTPNRVFPVAETFSHALDTSSAFVYNPVIQWGEQPLVKSVREQKGISLLYSS